MGQQMTLNSAPLSAAGLRGNVVLIDFWTYTCINWLRTLPYVRAWTEKYQDKGLVVIGVSTPEFEFEHAIENVRRPCEFACSSMDSRPALHTASTLTPRATARSPSSGCTS